METQPRSNNFSLFFFIILLLIFLIPIYYLNVKRPAPGNQPVKTEATPTVSVEAGRMQLQLDANTPSYTLGESIPVYIAANSAGKSIAGFDIVVSFNPELVGYETYNVSLPEFQSTVREQGNTISIVAFKKLSETGERILQDTKLATLTFKPKKPGVARFEIQFSPGSTKDSNLMTDEQGAKDILGTVKGVEVTVASEVTLYLNQPVTLKGSDLTVTLTNAQVPDDRCYDCMTTATLKVVQKNQTKELDFQIGGVAGLLNTTQDAFGYTFNLQDVSKNSVKINYFQR